MIAYTEYISEKWRPIMATIPAEVIRNRKPDAAPTPLMGWYMPFAGVRYYKRMTNVDVALGDCLIGSVGWRAERPAEDTAPREAVAV